MQAVSNPLNLLQIFSGRLSAPNAGSELWLGKNSIAPEDFAEKLLFFLNQADPQMNESGPQLEFTPQELDKLLAMIPEGKAHNALPVVLPLSDGKSPDTMMADKQFASLQKSLQGPDLSGIKASAEKVMPEIEVEIIRSGSETALQSSEKSLQASAHSSLPQINEDVNGQQQSGQLADVPLKLSALSELADVFDLEQLKVGESLKLVAPAGEAKTDDGSRELATLVLTRTSETRMAEDKSLTAFKVQAEGAQKPAEFDAVLVKQNDNGEKAADLNDLGKLIEKNEAKGKARLVLFIPDKHVAQKPGAQPQVTALQQEAKLDRPADDLFSPMRDSKTPTAPIYRPASEDLKLERAPVNQKSITRPTLDLHETPTLDDKSEKTVGIEKSVDRQKNNLNLNQNQKSEGNPNRFAEGLGRQVVAEKEAQSSALEGRVFKANLEGSKTTEQQAVKTASGTNTKMSAEIPLEQNSQQNMTEAKTAPALESTQKTLQSTQPRQVTFKMDAPPSGKTLAEGGTFRIKMEPESLGKIDVQLRVVGDQMNARLEVSSHLARHMVESNLPQLRETLATQGIKVDSFSVDVSGGNQGQDNSGQAANQNGGRSGFANRGNFAHSPESMPENQNRTMGAQNLRGRINLFA
ncbi:MAG: hypothetical protein GF404_08405 [candidate division Zixibacteria bacterium]|nr:hypothetical protein [candidate division Zixibacteria bacterium]